MANDYFYFSVTLEILDRDENASQEQALLYNLCTGNGTFIRDKTCVLNSVFEIEKYPVIVFLLATSRGQFVNKSWGLAAALGATKLIAITASIVVTL